MWKNEINKLTGLAPRSPNRAVGARAWIRGDFEHLESVDAAGRLIYGDFHIKHCGLLSFLLFSFHIFITMAATRVLEGNLAIVTGGSRGACLSPPNNPRKTIADQNQASERRLPETSLLKAARSS